jgi:hypothetical protein
MLGQSLDISEKSFIIRNGSIGHYFQNWQEWTFGYMFMASTDRNCGAFNATSNFAAVQLFTLMGGKVALALFTYR